jgi:hypothetical protein
VRVAYLVEKSEHWSEIMDAAIAEAYSRWCGTRTLFVPVVAGDITAQYWDWLRWWDPDLIYSYPSLNSHTVQKISERIVPIWFNGHRTYGPSTGRFDPRPRPAVRGLYSRSVLPFLAIPKGHIRESPTKLINQYPQWTDDGFVGDNFGTDERCFGGFPMMPAMRQIIEPLNLVPADAPANRYHFRDAGLEIHSSSELLRLMAADHTIISMCDLASWAPSGIVPLTRRDTLNLRIIRNHPWAETFNLVVGDGFEDRICFWNARLLVDPWRGASHFTALRLPECRVTDADFVDALIALFKSRKWSLPPGQDHHRIRIRSSTLSEPDLESVADKIRAEVGCEVLFSRIDQAVDVCPNRVQLQDDLPIRDERGQYVSATIGLIASPRPFHIAELPATSAPNLMDGVWIVDHKVDRHNDNSPYSNVRHWWRIPRRIGLARLFMSTNTARVTTDGYLAAAAKVDEPHSELRLPDDPAIFRAILHGQDWFPHDDLRQPSSPAPAFQYSRFSNDGRYLEGTLHLFGDLLSAFQIVSCRFWRNLFMELGAPSRGDESATIREIVARIRPRLGDFDFRSDSAWERLGKTVLVEAGRVRFPAREISFPDLKTRWERERDEALTRFTPDATQKEDFLRFSEQSFEDSVKSLCSHGILTQGHQWTCRRCAHRNWSSVDDVSQRLKCAICRTEFQIAPDFSWHFHLNEFLASGIRERGHLALIWATGELLHDSRYTFLFSPPLWLFKEYPKQHQSKPDAELDILCIRDGKLVIGEAKSSARDLTEKGLAPLIEVTRILRPDIVVVSCMETQPRQLTKLADWLRCELADVGCEVQAVVPDVRFNEASDLLPVL